MSVLDKLLDAVKLNDDYDDEEFLDDDLLDDEEDDFLDDEDGEKPVKKFFQKFGKKKDSEEDYDDYDDEEEKMEAPKAVSKPVIKTPPTAKTSSYKQDKPVRTSSKITPMRSSRKGTASANMEVCVIKPSSMEDTREIADTLVDNSTVVLNLEGLDVELAQRIIDFTSGACYSLGGSLQKVSSYIFILGPYNVDITGDLQNILGSAPMPSVRAGY
nr:cell division protein SepF [uncultured Blautia sp.]